MRRGLLQRLPRRGPLPSSPQSSHASTDSRERSMPPVSGLLTTVSYLFPAIARLLQPALAARGRRVKRRLKAEMRASKADAG